MKNFNMKSIANDIYNICFDVDLNIAHQSADDAKYLAKSNSLRHAHTIVQILNYAKLHNKKNLKILNASGLSCGTQDFSIISYLRSKTSLNIDWHACESPNSEYLENAIFKKYIVDCDIHLNLVDFASETTMYNYNVTDSLFDIVLFTEIVEHLDYSVFYKTLLSIVEVIKGDGVLILTTPNLVSLINRVKFVFGIGDAPYWGDGLFNLQKGLNGHITNYCIRRLKKILGDLGFEVITSYTFTSGHGPSEIKIINKLALRLIMALESLIPNSAESILIVAKKGNVTSIPFQI